MRWPAFVFRVRRQSFPALGMLCANGAMQRGTVKSKKRRLRDQFDAYADSGKKRFPDAFLASIEAVEDAIQRAAGRGRGARLMNQGPGSGPVKLEELLATSLLDDPRLPLAVERTRQPRPEIPPPPPRGDPLWGALRSRAKGERVDETGVEAANQDSNQLLATLAISDSKVVPTIVDGPYGGWRLVAAVERTHNFAA